MKKRIRSLSSNMIRSVLVCDAAVLVPFSQMVLVEDQCTGKKITFVSCLRLWARRPLVVVVAEPSTLCFTVHLPSQVKKESKHASSPVSWSNDGILANIAIPTYSNCLDFSTDDCSRHDDALLPIAQPGDRQRFRHGIRTPGKNAPTRTCIFPANQDV